MSTPTATPISQSSQRLLGYLPAIYSDDPFIGRYLWAFEQVLLGLEQTIDGLASYFDPALAPEEFLPWLSSWVAFTLHADLPAAQQRAFLANIVSLYRRRGTLANLQKLLSIFSGGVPTVTEDPTQPHSFQVTLSLPKNFSAVDPTGTQRQLAIAHALIDLERPSHTTYTLIPQFLTMQIGVTSTIGVDTLLGTDDPGTAT